MEPCGTPQSTVSIGEVLKGEDFTNTTKFVLIFSWKETNVGWNTYGGEKQSIWCSGKIITVNESLQLIVLVSTRTLTKATTWRIFTHFYWTIAITLNTTDVIKQITSVGQLNIFKQVNESPSKWLSVADQRHCFMVVSSLNQLRRVVDVQEVGS